MGAGRDIAAAHVRHNIHHADTDRSGGRHSGIECDLLISGPCNDCS